MITPFETWEKPQLFNHNTKKYYTVDLRRTLFACGIISLQHRYPKASALECFLFQKYPKGLSKHGYNYLFNPGQKMDDSTEDSIALLGGLILELVRRAEYPHKTSRYEALFAVESLEAAKEFRLGQSKTESDHAAPIYEVYTEGEPHKGDMNLIDMNCSALEFYHRAHLYWQGKSEQLHDKYEPFWEILLPLPAYTAMQVTD